MLLEGATNNRSNVQLMSRRSRFVNSFSTATSESVASGPSSLSEQCSRYPSPSPR